MEGMDFLQGIKDAEQLKSGEENSLPSIEQMMESLENMELSDEQKANLKDLLLGRGKIGEDLIGNVLQPPFQLLPGGNPLMYAVLILAFFVILPLFGKLLSYLK